jgi:hypothetical protein
LFFNEKLICIKNIQIVIDAFAEAIGKLQVKVAHNFIHRNCAQLLWMTGRIQQPKPVVRLAPLR